MQQPFSFTAGIRNANLEAAYTDDDSFTLLKAYDNQGLLGTNTAFLTAPMYRPEHAATLKPCIQEKLDQGAELILCKLTITSPTGNRDSFGELTHHAVSLIIDTNRQKIIYADPYGIGMDSRPETYRNDELAHAPSLRQALEALGTGYNIECASHRVQFDKFSCAPLTVNNLAYYAQHHALPETVDLTAIREEQFALLQAHDHEQRQQRLATNRQGLSLAAQQSIDKLKSRYILSEGQQNELMQRLEDIFATWQEKDLGNIIAFADLVKNGLLSTAGQRVATSIEEQLALTIIRPQPAETMTERIEQTLPKAEIRLDALNDAGWQSDFHAKIKSAANSIAFSFKKNTAERAS